MHRGGEVKRDYRIFLRTLAIAAVIAVGILVIGSTYGEPPLWGV